MATIGVTRGFGDHELRAQNSEVFIKPFLSSEPEVRIINLEKDDNLTEDDVLIMATDGLWVSKKCFLNNANRFFIYLIKDITSNEKCAEICYK